MEKAPERPALVPVAPEPQEPICEHREEAVRLRELANGELRYGKQCLRCGHWRFVAKSALSPRQLATYDLYSEELVKAWDEKRTAWYAHRQNEWQRQKTQQNADWWQRYTAHLETPEWRRKRAAVLKRAGNVCEGCGEAAPAHVHHLTYDHMGDEFLFELVALCPACHKRLHAHLDIGPQLVWGGRS